jgi:hypothetical protein
MLEDSAIMSSTFHLFGCRQADDLCLQGLSLDDFAGARHSGAEKQPSEGVELLELGVRTGSIGWRGVEDVIELALACSDQRSVPDKQACLLMGALRINCYFMAHPSMRTNFPVRWNCSISLTLDRVRIDEKLCIIS